MFCLVEFVDMMSIVFDYRVILNYIAFLIDVLSFFLWDQSMGLGCVPYLPKVSFFSSLIT